MNIPIQFPASREYILSNPRQRGSGERILYLDYDGVLHDEKVCLSRKSGIYIATPGRKLFEWMPLLEEALQPHEDVKIVLSTTWVRVRGYEFAKQQLSPSLQRRVIGATFHRRHMDRELFSQLPRGQQIALDVFRRGPADWLAIDDDALDWPEWSRNNLIQTDGSLGISDPEIRKAISGYFSRNKD